MNINYQGNGFKNSYVKTKFNGSEIFYDEISNFFESKQKYENDTNLQKKKHPNWHENQILSLSNIIWIFLVKDLYLFCWSQNLHNLIVLATSLFIPFFYIITFILKH